MSTLEHFKNNLKDTFDHLGEGWQQLWSKASNAITRFTPFSDKSNSDHPLIHRASHWSVLSAEVRETSKDIEVQLEAPGIDPDDFEISTRNQTLIVTGKKHYANDRKEGRFHITERAYGSFERAISLPTNVDDSKASASYKKGVLTVTLPKTEVSHLHNIKVVSD